MNRRSRAFLNRCRQAGLAGLPLLFGGCADESLVHSWLLPKPSVARAAAPEVAEQIVKAADADGSEESEESSASTPHGSLADRGGRAGLWLASGPRVIRSSE